MTGDSKNAAAGQQAKQEPRASFLSDLAQVLFDTPADQSREALEQKVVERTLQLLNRATPRQIVRVAAFIDYHLLPSLSGRNFLAVAKLLEVRAPAALEVMPKMRQKREVLKRAERLAGVLQADNIQRLIDVVRNHGRT
jgi:hypothetical protein